MRYLKLFDLEDKVLNNYLIYNNNEESEII